MTSMTDFILPFVFLVLLAIIIFQAVERYFFAQQAQVAQDKLLEELSRATKAVIAKNANDYVMTTSIDKVPTDRAAPQAPDLIDPDTLSDDEFDSALGIKRTPPK